MEIKDVSYQTKRMLKEACDYKNGADILSTHIFETIGNSANMLALTALEILLKALYLLEKKELYKNGGHSFKDIFYKLNGKTQNQILNYANEISVEYRTASNDSFDFISALKQFRSNFSDARYSYEKDIYLTEEELKKKSEDWINSDGLVTTEADFTFYPSERSILFKATKQTLEERLVTS